MVTKFIVFAFAWYLVLPPPFCVCHTNCISFHLISISISKICVIPFALAFVTINLITLFLLFDSNNFCVVTKAHNYNIHWIVCSMQVIHQRKRDVENKNRNMCCCFFFFTNEKVGMFTMFNMESIFVALCFSNRFLSHFK